jgi:hypothetical protein
LSSDAHREAFEKVLTGSLDRTIDFIKFAEAKNAALLTFGSGCAAAIASVLIAEANAARAGTSTSIPIPGLATAFTIAMALFAVAILIALWSFLPSLRPQAFHRDPNQSTNLLYFGHVAKYDAVAFRQNIRARYLARSGPTLSEDYLDDLSDQIAINSAIANQKFKAFNIGAFVTLAAVVVALWPLVVAILRTLLT